MKCLLIQSSKSDSTSVIHRENGDGDHSSTVFHIKKCLLLTLQYLAKLVIPVHRNCKHESLQQCSTTLWLLLQMAWLKISDATIFDLQRPWYISISMQQSKKKERFFNLAGVSKFSDWQHGGALRHWSWMDSVHQNQVQKIYEFMTLQLHVITWFSHFSAYYYITIFSHIFCTASIFRQICFIRTV
jgi:hypothetical protein